jgi:SAM-dependent MidA family methyltransferase
MLARHKTADEQKNILSAVEKLVSPEYMGERFLYLCVQDTKRERTPAGFSSID